MDVAGQACSKQNYIFLPGSENSKWLTLGAATSADESNTILRAVRLAALKYTRSHSFSPEAKRRGARAAVIVATLWLLSGHPDRRFESYPLRQCLPEETD